MLMNLIFKLNPRTTVSFTELILGYLYHKTFQKFKAVNWLIHFTFTLNFNIERNKLNLKQPEYEKFNVVV